MAASTSTFPSLSVPAADDTMDMSSPANRNLDDDIEIDFDDPPGGVATLTDDEQMLEDITRPATATDDIMDDDVQQGETFYEEVMQDDGVQLDDGIAQHDDDELIDYGEDEAIVEDTEIAIADEAPSITFEEAPEAHAEVVLEPTTEQPAEVSDNVISAEHMSGEAAELSEPEATHGLNDPTYISSEEAAVDLGTDAAAQEDAYEQGYEEYHEGQVAAEEGDADGQSLSVNPTYPVTSSGPDTPTDTGLHPMTVRYNELQIPLFKSKRQLDGLLKNDNMASVSLVDLMNACRQQLRKRELDIPESQSVVLAFHQLGLIVSDESSSASATSLNEVLEAYLQLHYNEGWQEIEPLSLTISTQLKFSSLFNMLKNAAALGQGISEFSAIHADAEGELEQSYFEEEKDWYDTRDDEHAGYAGDEGYEETAQDNVSGQLATQPHDEVRDPTTLAQEEHGENPTDEDHSKEPDQEYDYDENQHLDYVADPGEAAEALDALSGHSTEAEYGPPTQELEGEQEQDTAQPATTEEHPASTASSTTIQGDREPGTTASKCNSYEEIDWDADDLTTTTPGTGRKDQALQLSAADTTNSDALDQTLPADYDAVDEEVTNNADQQLPGSEDLINYEETFEGELEDHAHDPDGPNGNGEQEDFTNTDPYPQHNKHEGAVAEDEDHSHYQPYDDEDQFHTAHEGFGDGDFYEHGLEHTEYHETAAEIQQVEEEEEFDDTVLIHPQGDEVTYHDEEAAQPHPADDFEDEIDFGEDEDEVGEDQPSPATVPPADFSGIRGSPKGKRSFDEIDGVDDSELQKPETKKSRPS